MRYAQINKNDATNGSGVCVSFWAQGCPYRCDGCHNPQTWCFDGGIEADDDFVISEIINAINANGITRNFSLLGGEPLCDENKKNIRKILNAVKEKFPDILVFAWTGGRYENIVAQNDPDYNYILSQIDVMVDGPFILSQRDITLKWRGSTNQRIIDVKKTRESGRVILYE